MTLVMAVPHALSMSNFNDVQTLLVSALSFILVCLRFLRLLSWPLTCVDSGCFHILPAIAAAGTCYSRRQGTTYWKISIRSEYLDQISFA